MGHTYAKVTVRNPRNTAEKLELELIVDTGSTYTWIRRDKLERLGVRPFGRRRFKTIKGEIMEREVGEAVIECLGVVPRTARRRDIKSFFKAVMRTGRGRPFTSVGRSPLAP